MVGGSRRDGECGVGPGPASVAKDPACPAGNVSYSQVTAQLKELPGYL